MLRWRSTVSLLTCTCLISAASTPASSIGIVMTTGAVQVDGLQVPNSSAIFEGNLIDSGNRSASVQFSDGTTAMMKPGTKLSVYRGYSVLQHGVTMQGGIDRHPIVADGLKISGLKSNSAALVGVRDASYIEVAAQEGEADVLAPTGELVARVEPGKTLSFTIAQADGTQQSSPKICGTLGQNYQLTDAATGVTYQLQGSNLGSFVGATVQVTGTIAPANPPANVQIVQVSQIKKQSKPCVPAGGQGAAPAVAGGTWKGLAGILIFVGIGASLLGIAASGGFGVSQPAVTPTTP
jgi:hypothetical protein